MDNVFYIINDNKVELSNGKEYSLVDFIDILVNYINQLETNRDELKKWLENHWEQSQDIWFVKILNKMQELERGKE